MSTLFKYYPTFNYGDTLASNIMVRAVFRDIVKKNAVVFYPYTIKEGERPDHIAQDYYGSSRYDWMIYLANDMLDPYYDWPLTNYDFNAYINNKYGGVANAQEEIAFWRVNWSGDDSTISVSSYNSLTSSAKKYWTLDADRGINYVRKQIDTALDTNKVIQIVVDDGTLFNIGEKIVQKTAGVITGTGNILYINDNTLVCNHITGTFVTTESCYNVAGDVADVTGVTTIHNSIADDDVIYWESVSRYDYEMELNEQKKHIRVIDKVYILQIERELGGIFA